MGSCKGRMLWSSCDYSPELSLGSNCKEHCKKLLQQEQDRWCGQSGCRSRFLKQALTLAVSISSVYILTSATFQLNGDRLSSGSSCLFGALRSSWRPHLKGCQFSGVIHILSLTEWKFRCQEKTEFAINITDFRTLLLIQQYYYCMLTMNNRQKLFFLVHG